MANQSARTIGIILQYLLFNEGDVINPMSYLIYGLHSSTNTYIK